MPASVTCSPGIFGSSNYNSLMVVLRYVALVALVVWLGALQGDILGYRTIYATRIAFTCGALLMVCLFAIKFLGPPPRAFFTRVGIVFLMLVVTVLDRWLVSGPAPALVNAALGFSMLAWYAHE